MRWMSFILLLTLLFSCTDNNSDCKSGDCKNGWGREESANGGYYEGYFKNGKRNGLGTCYKSKEDITYKGNWNNGELQGYVEIAFGEKSESPGGFYHGHWKNGDMSGYGIKFWGMDPYFTLYRYEGYWKDGHLHGYGKHDWGDGSVYTGNFKMGDRSGYGEMKFEDSLGTYMYKGEWKKDKMHGYGEYYWADGSVYKGMWANGDHHGQGVYYDSSRKRYESVWEHGCCDEIKDFICIGEDSLRS